MARSSRSSSLRSTSALPGRRGRAPLALVAVGLALPLCGCASEPKFRSRRDDELELTELRELITQNTLKPVTDMEGDDPFAGIEANMSMPGEGEKPAAAVKEPVESDYPENPYIEFGTRIVTYGADDPRVMKPYALQPGMGKTVKDFVEQYAPFDVYTGGESQKETEVRIDVLEEFDRELFWSMRAPIMKAGDAVKLADWLVVTATPEYLREFEFFLNTFFARPPQIEIEAKIVEVTVTDEINVGVRGMIDMPGDGTFVKGLDYNLPNTVDPNELLLTLGAVQDGVSFDAILDALATYENVSISSHPKVAVREAALAKIENTTEIPFYNITGIQNQGGYNASLTFKPVGISLYVVPRVVGTNTVALNIDIEASQQSGTAVAFVSDDSELSNPIISKRAANTIVYLEPGQAVIIGGLVSERHVDQQKKVPLLGDIPVLGWLFRSTVKRKESTNVLFFIRPRILEGSDLNRDF